MLAPMEDITDSAMRRLCYNHGADITFTEMARIESLAKKEKTILVKTEIPDNTPTWIQLVGSDEQKLKKYLHGFEPAKGFLGFNFNLGCPSLNLVNNGVGCAMIKRIAKTKKIIKIVKDRGYNSSIKLRLGLNNLDKKNKVYLKLIKNVDTDMFIVHSRVGTDYYDSPPDHSVLEECSETGKKIIANGDIKTKKDVSKVLGYGVKGVMIGRAAITNPLIFAELKNETTPTLDQLKKEYLALANKFNSPFKYRKNVLKRLENKD